MLLSLDVSIDRNTNSKYNDSLYEFKQGIRKLMKEANIENKNIEEYLIDKHISAYDHKKGLVFMEFYSNFDNKKLQELLFVEN